MLLSTFVWTNRLTTNFATVYGAANAALATAIVDRALADWGKILVNFNRAGGSNTFNVTFSASNLGGTTRGSTGSITTDGNGVPTSARVTMDNDGGGAGWYFDATPGTADLPDDGEFGEIVNPFMSRMPGGSDFYRTVAHEICHAVGILLGGSAYRISQFLTNTQIPDPNDSTQRLWAFNVNGGAVEATLSSVGGGHLYEGPAVPNHPELPFHPGDLINSGRSITPPPSSRQLISDTDVMVLVAAYGYTMLTPSQVNSFHANLNTTTNLLTVQGGPGTSADTITLDTIGGDVRVRVNETSELFPAAEVDSIVVNAGDGADVIHVDESLAGVTITLNASEGNDSLSVNADGTGQARVRLDAAQRLGRLTVGAGGALDVNGQALVIDYDGESPVASVEALLASGYDNGTWTGDGINWSAGNANTRAVGYAEATDLFTTFPATFAGQQVDDTSVLIRATRYGDADLDGTTNLNDFNRLAASFGQTSRRWSQGNFNFDALVNLDDFNLLAANFGASASAAAVVPFRFDLRSAPRAVDELLQ